MLKNLIRYLTHLFRLMKKKLVFIGNYGNRNIGDDAILHVLSRRYQKKFPDYKQYVFARYYPNDIRRISIATPLDLSLKSIFWVLCNCDVIVIGGGGIFSGYTGPKAKFIPFLGIVSKILGKKVIYESIGLYSTADYFQRYSVLLSMLLADEISVRDIASLQSVIPIMKLKKIKLVADPGYSIRPISIKQVKEILRKEDIKISNHKVIGISVKRGKNNTTNAKIIFELVKVINWIVAKRNYTVLLIPFCNDRIQYTEKDLEFSLEILSKIKKQSCIFCLKNYYTPQEIAGVLKLCDVFVGMRYHSLVFAYTLGIPLIPISYEEKCMDFVKKHHYPYIEADSFTYKDINVEIKNFLDINE
ncbi:hypothetical protein A2960_01695 [Candidatus Gottesmanbacteria bacterium RIFCSPLOWO2_01_FULL_39_12b]|uniref:Polysaccharide pyruvyl transferase domain-containing protein n=1 Tax=Candidatus Gottesmanbacteria bacterium RIFCSPLOWO2_01_FULL_39_12b TaxID=1798388 RepID=A0A1F6AQ90_9BACT|nr:MAG: hypothetical protein A2960_01695 [Candidatus Gottesmanbacteria bacterium RIFCSPLOWO2_01_FULL_39_12b]